MDYESVAKNKIAALNRKLDGIKETIEIIERGVELAKELGLTAEQVDQIQYMLDECSFIDDCDW